MVVEDSMLNSISYGPNLEIQNGGHFQDGRQMPCKIMK